MIRDRHFREAAARGRAEADNVLEVDDLRTYFFTRRGIAKAVNGLSFAVKAGETLAIVGESGCGKSMTALSIMGLISSPPGRIVGGEVRFKGKDLTRNSEREMRQIRGNAISMIFQDPMTSLNPLMTIGSQIAEVYRLHRKSSRKAAYAEAIAMLKLVKIPEAERRAGEYPHQLSGGMRQRAMIAMALACGPEVLLADEPTTALDVTIQAQIVDLIVDMQNRLNTAVIFITHDLGVVAEIADRVVVMYAGQKVEEATVFELFENPRHPYTRSLMKSVPDYEQGVLRQPNEGRLSEIPGMVPSLWELPEGCAFSPRCKLATEKCSREAPPLEKVGDGHFVTCWHSEQDWNLHDA